MSTLVICENPKALAVRAVELITEIAREALEGRGRFTIALCGGKTPEETYRLLGQPEQAAIDWLKTYIFFGDERFVPHDDPRSNYGMAHRALLSQVPIPAAQVFPVPTGLRSAAESAEVYANELAAIFAAEVGSCQLREEKSPIGAPHCKKPRFDLILLGLGEDGHAASLFPGSSTLQVKDKWVTWSLPGTLPPKVERITFTYPLLNAARNVIFLVTGEQKAATLHEILEGRASPEIYPAAGVQPEEGKLIWLIDSLAAKKLTPSFCGQNAIIASSSPKN